MTQIEWDLITKNYPLPPNTLLLLAKIQSELVIHTLPKTSHRNPRQPPGRQQHQQQGRQPQQQGREQQHQQQGREQQPQGREQQQQQQQSQKPSPPKQTCRTVVQCCLNKITDTNYSSQFVIIRNAHHELSLSEPTTIIDLIFRSATSGIHARLIHDLSADSSENEKIREHLHTLLLQFELEINAMCEGGMSSIDPAIDYDAFCKYTKLNDRHRSTAAFFVHLSNTQLVNKPTVVLITQHLLIRIMTIVELPDKLVEVENLSEIIARLVPAFVYKHPTIPTPEEHNCFDRITQIGQFKANEKQSFSSRVMFKYRDLVGLFR